MSLFAARYLACACLLWPHALWAEVRLPALFSEHMVLQRAAATPVWGRANAGEHVKVTLGAKVAEADADATGRWRVELNLQDGAAGPIEMIVEGRNRVVIEDVVVGEVWVASGQSNMELPLRVTAGAEGEMARSANPGLREFAVRRTRASQPLEDCEGRWTISGPATAGEFSAIGYYFGKELQAARREPVGILHASNGGTYIEPWTPVEALERIEEFREPVATLRRRAAEYPAARAKFTREFATWLKAWEREDMPCPDPGRYAATGMGTADWTEVNLPGKVTADGFPRSGIFWLRRELEVSAILARQGFKVMIGALDGYWQVYWNGKLLTETTYAQLPGRSSACYFAVPPEQILTGRNTLAIRLYSPVAPLAVPGRALWAGPIVLDGKWLATVERAFPEIAPEDLASAPKMTYEQPEMLPGSLYNARIHPLTRYAIAGVLWYQGESNVPRAFQYRLAFPALIAGWRAAWKREDLPFYFCQLCNNNPKLAAPGESAWAELRESQAKALALPGTGQAVTIDLGEAGDLHFRDKKTAAHRLFVIAQAEHYGLPVVFSGPVYESMTIEPGRARIRFRHADQGLLAATLPATYPVKTLLGETAPLVRYAPRGELEGFAICGEDRQWCWAEAAIEGETVLVWSEKVARPVAVRYAWADNPTCNLTNGAGLPAAPFRTDGFPAITAQAHY